MQQIVVVEFMRRKLAFVFKELQATKGEGKKVTSFSTAADSQACSVLKGLGQNNDRTRMKEGIPRQFCT